MIVILTTATRITSLCILAIQRPRSSSWRKPPRQPRLWLDETSAVKAAIIKRAHYPLGMELGHYQGHPQERRWRALAVEEFAKELSTSAPAPRCRGLTYGISQPTGGSML